MSERFSKTGLSSGSSWSLLAENTAFEESDAVIEKLGKFAETTRLHVEDSKKFGFCPSRTYLQLAVCKQCQKLVMLSAVQSHYETKHRRFLSSVKPSLPKRCVSSSLHSPPVGKSSTATTYSKSKVLKAGSSKAFIRIEAMDPNEVNVKIEEVPLTIPKFNNAVKVKLPKINIKKLACEAKKSNLDKVTSPVTPSQVCIQVKGNIKKIPQLKEKEYDVDKHCGVWIPEIDKNCTRSLTCKTHPLSLRRQVPGRSKDFDVLLAEHRARVALKAQDNASNASMSPQSSSRGGTPVNSPFGFDKIVFPSVPIPSATNYRKDLAGSNIKSSKNVSSKSTTDDRSNGFLQQIYVDYISDDVIGSCNLPTIIYHPKPIKMNTFGGRQTDCRCRLFSRRMDHFRNASVSMLDRYSNATSIKQTIKDPATNRSGQDGTRAAIQDPLQNGIIHKQKSKSSKVSGTKRQLSLNDGQDIIADPLSYAASSKRRHPSEVPVNDPFSLVNQPNLNRSLSNQTFTSQQVVKVKEFQRPSNDNLTLHRPKSANAYLTNTVVSSSSNVFRGNFVVSTGQLNSSLNLSQSVNIKSTDGESVHQNPLVSSFTASSKVMAAPNVTVTQGMLVSLPAAVLQNNQQNIYSIGSHIKDLMSQSTPSRIVQPVTSSQSSQLALKQALSDVNLMPIENGVNSLSTQEVKNYSIGYSNVENQQPAPNVTVTASISLSGVLQGHAVSATLSSIAKPTYKRTNNTHTDQAGLLQQLIVQQSNINRDALQNNYKVNQPSVSLSAQSLQTVQQKSSLQQQQQQPQQSDNFLNNPHLATVNSQPMKQLQKMQIQQLHQQQIPTQQFITMHHGYQQQILPKLPTVPQNISQFNSSQFSPATAQASVQYMPQGTASNTIQQQHGGALS